MQKWRLPGPGRQHGGETDEVQRQWGEGGPAAAAEPSQAADTFQINTFRPS